MATIRAYTTIEQSRKLAEILPLESADQTWERITSLDAAGELQYGHEYKHNGDMPFQLYSGIGVPCWSLATLFSVLPHIQEFYPTLEKINDKYVCRYKSSGIWTNGDNPVDACVTMIIKLHEQKIL